MSKPNKTIESPPVLGGDWETYDPEYGTCPIGSMPCTPDGCHENHPVGKICVSFGCDEYEPVECPNEEIARLVAAAPLLLDACRIALEHVPSLLWDDTMRAASAFIRRHDKNA